MSKLLTAAVAAAMITVFPVSMSNAGDKRHDGAMHDMDDSGSMSGSGMGGCPMMQGMQHGMKSGMKPEKSAMMGGGMMTGAMIEQRLTKVKAGLKITDAQTQAWDGYANAVKAQGDTMKSNRETMMKAMGEGTAVSKIETHVAAMEKMVGALKTLKTATEALYASLDETQKKTADNVLGAGCMM